MKVAVTKGRCNAQTPHPKSCAFTMILIMLVVFTSTITPIQAFSSSARYSQSSSINGSYSPAFSVGQYTVPGTNQTYTLGWIPEQVPAGARVTLARATPVPQHFDWRNKDGYNWVGAVKDQGGCGSCVAFAAVGATEMQYRIAYNNPSWNLDLSEQHLFSCGGGSCAQGWTFSSALNYLKSTGTPDESCFPYQSGNGADRSCSATCPTWQSRVYKINDWNWNTAGPTVIETALMNGPVLAAFTVYSDFFSYTGGVYHHTSTTVVGGHAVVIVGYDIPGQYWIVKNSWGANWGDHGFFEIGFGEGGIDSWTTSITVRSPNQNTVTFNTDPASGTITVDGSAKTSGTSGSYTTNQRVHVIANPPSGYKFLNWETSVVAVDSESAADTYMTVSSSGWLKAHFAIIPPQQYSVTFNTDPTSGAITVNGTILNNGQTGTYNVGSRIHVTPNTPGGYAFARWEAGGVAIDNPSSPDTYVIVSNSGWLTAHFAQSQYTVAFYTDPNSGTISIDGTTRPNGATGSYTINQRVHVVAGPPSGYTFASWSMNGVTVDDQSASDSYMTVQGSGTLKANFTPAQPQQYTVNFTADPSSGTITADGIAEANGQAGTYTAGARVHVVAAPANGYAFSSWETSGVSVDNTQVPDTYMAITSNGGLTAHFAIAPPTQYTVTFHTDPNSGIITADGATETDGTSGTYISGQRVHVVAYPPSGYTFSSWETVGVTVDNQASQDTYLTATGSGGLTAHFAQMPPQLYTVTFNTDPSSATISVDTTPKPDGATASYSSGQRVHVVANPPSWYQFLSWDASGVSVDSSSTADTYMTVSASGSLKAHFALIPPQQYTVVFYTDPSSGTITADGTAEANGASATYNQGQTIHVIATPPSGYQFAGWETSGVSVATPASQDTYLTVSNNGWLKAHFAQVTYTVIFNSDPSSGTITAGGASEVDGATEAYAFGSRVDVIANPPSGYAFVSWESCGVAIDSSSASATTMTVTKNGSLKAHFAQITYSVTFNTDPTNGIVAADGNAKTNGATGTYTSNQRVHVVAIPPNGYVFTGWNAQGLGLENQAAPDTFMTVTGSGTLKARFVLITYTVTFYTDPTSGVITIDGTPNVNGAAGTYLPGQRVHVVAGSLNGYTFTGWETSGITVESPTVADTYMAVVKVGWLKAHFAPNQYSVTFSTDPTTATITADGNAKANGAKTTYLFSQRVHVIANPPSGYYLTSWDVSGVAVDNRTAPDTFMTVTGSGTLKARFVLITYTVTFYTDPTSGIITADGTAKGSGAAGTYLPAQRVHIVATPPTGYYFTGWETSGITVDKASAVDTYMAVVKVGWLKAHFAPNQYSVTFSTDPTTATITADGNAKANGAKTTYLFSQRVHVIANIPTGYLFAGWSVSGVAVDSRTAPDTFMTVTGSGTLKASFTPITYTVTFNDDPASGTITVDGTAKTNGQTVLYKPGARPHVVAKQPSGYVFTGWSTSGISVDKASAQDTYLTVSSNGWVKASFTKVPVVTVKARLVTGTEVASVQITVDTTKYVTPFALAIQGTHTFTATTPIKVNGLACNFIGWSDQTGSTVSTQAAFSYNVQSDKTLYAVYEPPKVTLTLYAVTTSAILGAKTQKGVAGVAVYLNSNMMGTTDSTGKLVITTYAGAYTLKVAKTGYAVYAVAITLTGSTSYTVCLK